MMSDLGRCERIFYLLASDVTSKDCVCILMGLDVKYFVFDYDCLFFFYFGSLFIGIGISMSHNVVMICFCVVIIQILSTTCS